MKPLVTYPLKVRVVKLPMIWPLSSAKLKGNEVFTRVGQAEQDEFVEFRTWVQLSAHAIVFAD